MDVGAVLKIRDANGMFAVRRIRQLLQLRYVLAALSVLAALMGTMVLDNLIDERPTLFLFFAAIVFSAWNGGPWAGVLAVLLSIPCGLYFYSHDFESLHLELQDAVLLLFFMFCATVGGWLSAWQRRANTDLTLKAAQLEAANDGLRTEIAERRRAEQALLETRAELARVARLTTMGELAASIAHEINQPLAAISTNAGACIRWLSRDPPNLPEVRLSASRIARDSERAAAVVDRVRQLARGSVPEQSEIDVNGSVTEIRTLLESEFRKHRIKTAFDLATGLPSVVADRIQMQQVFMNIFLNAIDAMSKMPQAGRSLLIRSRREGDHVAIEIQDTGAGFDGNAERLFEPFYSTKPSGMGLGLSICRSIMEAHGGSLSAERVSSGGALFRVTLPAKEA